MVYPNLTLFLIFDYANTHTPGAGLRTSPRGSAFGGLLPGSGARLRLFLRRGGLHGTLLSPDHPPLLLRLHLFLIRDAEPRPCHRGDVPDALAG